jgi:hypothetical protein
MMLEILLEVTDRETSKDGDSDTQTQMNEYSVLSLIFLETWRSTCNIDLNAYLTCELGLKKNLRFYP